MNIRKKISLISLATAAGLLILSLTSLLTLNTSIHKEIAQATQQKVETTYGVVDHFYAMERSGKMTRAQAQSAALAVIRDLRYGENDYFWVNDMHPRMLMHPLKPQLDGTDISKNADPSGKRLFVEMVETVKAHKAGFVDYVWDKPDGTKAAPKISYVKGFAPWGWVIGTGVYVDDVRTTIMSDAMWLALAIAVIMLMVYAVNRKLGRSIVEPIETLTDRMRGLADGDTQSPIPSLDRDDETGRMAQALDVFRAAAIGKAAAEANQQEAIHRIGQHLGRLSNGDLAERITTIPAGYETLQKDFNQALDGLERALIAVSENSDSISVNLEGLRDASLDLSSRTENQASALEEVSSALAEVTGTVRSTAESAANVAGVVADVARDAKESGEVVRRAITAMDQIEAGSIAVRDVTAVIDSIAFQTNLLALNAGVEAARAGDAGKGFAVVADEVRALALRSADAAREVNQQVGASVDQVHEGVQMVNEAGAALQRISGQIEEINTLIASIADSANHQATKISEVNGTVTGMEAITQQNAAMAEEATAACTNLSVNATALTSEVARFALTKPVASAAWRPARAA